MQTGLDLDAKKMAALKNQQKRYDIDNCGTVVRHLGFSDNWALILQQTFSIC